VNMPSAVSVTSTITFVEPSGLAAATSSADT
jgi:hypothetical protein